jgi:hypothetical protein
VQIVAARLGPSTPLSTLSVDAQVWASGDQAGADVIANVLG